MQSQAGSWSRVALATVSWLIPGVVQACSLNEAHSLMFSMVLKCHPLEHSIYLLQQI